jgi:hypothetical protein
MADKCRACERELESHEALARRMETTLAEVEIPLLRHAYGEGESETVHSMAYATVRPLAEAAVCRLLGVCTWKCRALIMNVVAALVVLMIGGGCASKVDADDLPARLPNPPTTLLLMAGERVHTVSAGESPAKVAALYSIPIKALIDRNPGRWHVGQTIVILAAKPESIRCQNVWTDASNITDADVEACLF